MKSWIRLVPILVASALLAACAGDDPASQDPGDGGTVDAEQEVGASAKSLATGADEEARAAAEGLVLYRIKGDRLVNGGREIDPAAENSYWQFNYMAPSGDKVDVIYSNGEYHVSTGVGNPDQLRFIEVEWMDSTLAVDKAAEAGYVPPAAGEADTTASATLEMYGGEDPTFSASSNPFWRIVKTTAPPGETPVADEWWVQPFGDPATTTNWFVCHLETAGTLCQTI